MPAIRRLATASLTPAELAEIRALAEIAFSFDEEEGGGFADEDWAHSLGGTHVVLEESGRILAHAAVVERVLAIDGEPIRTGYVEAVATDPARQGQGHGSLVMGVVNEIIRGGFDLGALGTGRFTFYERLGWERWRGPLSVRTAAGDVRTRGEDGYVLVLRTPTSPPLDLDAALSCDWRAGDVW